MRAVSIRERSVLVAAELAMMLDLIDGFRQVKFSEDTVKFVEIAALIQFVPKKFIIEFCHACVLVQVLGVYADFR